MRTMNSQKPLKTAEYQHKDGLDAAELIRKHRLAQHSRGRILTGESALVRFAMIWAVVFMSGCSSEETPRKDSRWESPKLAVGLMAARQTEGPLRFSLDTQEYEIDQFVVSVSAVEIHLCEVAANPFVSTAHAHVPSSATRLGTPVVDDVLRGGGSARIFGEIAPPAGDYCEVYVVVTPADEDIVNLTGVPLDLIVDHTAVAVGRIREAGGDWRDEVWTTDVSKLIRVDASFRLSAGEQAQLILTKAMTDDELVAPDDDTPGVADRLLDNVLETYRYYEPQRP